MQDAESWKLTFTVAPIALGLLAVLRHIALRNRPIWTAIARPIIAILAMLWVVDLGGQVAVRLEIFLPEADGHLPRWIEQISVCLMAAIVSVWLLDWDGDRSAS